MLVYRNGTSQDKAQYIWGSTLEQLLKEATVKLGMFKTATQFYASNGTAIAAFDDVSRDEVVCVSNGEAFKGIKGKAVLHW